MWCSPYIDLDTNKCIHIGKALTKKRALRQNTLWHTQTPVSQANQTIYIAHAYDSQHLSHGVFARHSHSRQETSALQSKKPSHDKLRSWNMLKQQFPFSIGSHSGKTEHGFWSSCWFLSLSIFFGPGAMFFCPGAIFCPGVKFWKRTNFECFFHCIFCPFHFFDPRSNLWKGQACR